VSVIVENGGHGGSDAAPVAQAVIDAYLDKIMPQNKNKSTNSKSEKSVLPVREVSDPLIEAGD
jgi:hypothetical protein